MKALLVYPKFPETFWGFKYAFRFIDKKASMPPLCLLTVASLLPKEWKKKLVDLNVELLKDSDIKWADYVFISAMLVQKKPALEVIERCKKLGVKVVAGGPLFTTHHSHFKEIDHIIVGEAEVTLPSFLKDIKTGTPQQVYRSAEFADLEKSPPPMLGLVKTKEYNKMAIQYSRGCPNNCEFCCITDLFGRKVRTKTKEQVLRELELLYNSGWRGNVFIVDDNFIGNKHRLKIEILPAIIEWIKNKNYPFSFATQVSINLADDEELMRMMALAGFNSVFVGIETVDDDCLVETGKFVNRNRDIIADVKKIHRFGLRVDGSFIVGFDNDKPETFNRIIRFIKKSNIPIAMVGLLNVDKGTKLYKRLEKEKRLIFDATGDSTDFSINFVPKIGQKTLLKGYRKILREVYLPKNYYLRICRFFNEYKLPLIKTEGISYLSRFRDIYSQLKSLIKIIFTLGILDEGRLCFWKLFLHSIFRQPGNFTLAMSLWVQGYHSRKIFAI
ncbi:B12-binding domain-containing radical SAM protein [Candidatus Woesearchaeota archaeon]|nr:B12-binding domain-containing radical SAM protein [Candidatus Woesearchaeota archaeon]